ncbi:MAG: metallophosphoesterase [Clostridia bacterium]|nr:metallophosphoesterase [Clostridia bacterium]
MTQDLLYSKLPLHCGADGKFKILALSDAHAGVGFSKQVAPAIQALVDKCRPDLVLFNGDTMGPGRIHVENQEQLRDVLTELTAPIEAAGIPWAHTFGNHDDNFGLANVDAEPVYESFAHCVSKAGDPSLSGCANYVLPIRAHGSDEIVFDLWCLDSHRGMNEFARQYGLPEDTRFVLPVHFAEGRGYDSVHFDQVMWYYTASQEIERRCGKKIPGLMCMHIPLPEMYLIYKNRDLTGFEGSAREEVGCGEMNPGLFSACLQRGDIKAMVFGHDHICDYIGTYCGVKLCYDGGIEYDAYQHDDLRGGRVFEIDEKNPEEINTYMLYIEDIMGFEGRKIKQR